MEVTKKMQGLAIEKAKNGQDNLSFYHGDKQHYYHSTRNPQRESQRRVGQLEIKDKTHVIFVGPGAGHDIEAHLSLNKGASFSVVEVDGRVYELKKAYYNKLAENPLFKGRFVLGEEALDKHLEVYKTWELELIVTPIIGRLFPQALEDFYQRIKEKKKAEKRRIQNNRCFEKITSDNVFRNYETTLKEVSFFQGISPQIKGKRVLLVAAGPSLNREIERLKVIKAQKKAYIFAVGSAVLTLVNNGMMPDGVFIIEARDVSFDHVLKRIIDKDLDLEIPLFYSSAINERSLKYYRGDRYYFRPLVDKAVAYYQMGDQTTLYTGTSVAVAGLVCLIKSDPKAIYLVGQNLAFIDDRAYADQIDHMTRGVEASLMADKKPVALVNGQWGSTNEAFSRYLEEIEKVIDFYQAANITNTTHQGAKIQGAPYRAFEGVYEEIMSETEDCMLTKVALEDLCFNEKDYKRKQEALIEAKYLFLKKIDQMIELFDDLNRYIKRQDEYNVRNVLITFDKQLGKINKNIYYDFIASQRQQTLIEILREITVEMEVMEDAFDVANLMMAYYPLFFKTLKEDAKVETIL